MPNGLDVAPQMRLKASGEAGGISLLFRAGERPDADTVERLIGASRKSGLPARVSHRPAGDAGWLEILASGLTFDLTGLAPGGSARIIKTQQSFGFEDGEGAAGCEAIAIVPSGHIASGAGLQPVVRTMMGMAANLALELPTCAVAWGPAGTVMEPRYFCRMVLNWLGGGAFPALGLAALFTGADGSMASRGLAHFIGQEMQLEAHPGESAAETAKLAVRVIDHLVRLGPLTEAQTIDAGSQTLLAEPSQVGKLVLVWREDRG